MVRSGGRPVAATDLSDEDLPYDAEGEFLSEMWSHLARAEELSTVPEALSNLDEVARNCEAIITRIRAWQADPKPDR